MNVIQSPDMIKSLSRQMNNMFGISMGYFLQESYAILIKEGGFDNCLAVRPEIKDKGFSSSSNPYSRLLA